MVVCTFKGLRCYEVKHFVWTPTITNGISTKFPFVFIIVSTDYSHFLITEIAVLQYCYNIGYTVDEEKGFIASDPFF